MVSSLYKEDIFDAIIAADSNGYITTNTSYNEIKENIYEFLEIIYDRDEIESFSEADWNLVDEVINEWCERNKGC